MLLESVMPVVVEHCPPALWAQTQVPCVPPLLPCVPPRAASPQAVLCCRHDLMLMPWLPMTFTLKMLQVIAARCKLAMSLGDEPTPQGPPPRSLPALLLALDT